MHTYLRNGNALMQLNTEVKHLEEKFSFGVICVGFCVYTSVKNNLDGYKEITERRRRSSQG